MPSKLIHAIEVLQDSPAFTVSHGAFLSWDDFNEFKETWKSQYSGASQGLTPIVLEIPPIASLVNSKEFANLALMQGVPVDSILVKF